MSLVTRDDLVACDGCGVVYDKLPASDFVRCPVCDHGTRKTTPMPQLGRVHKWWSKVEEE